MIALQICLSYIKKYWLVALAIVGAIVGYIVFRKSNVDLGAVLDGINSDHQKDLTSIQNKDQTIADAQKQIVIDEQKQLDAANQKYNDEQKALDAEQQTQANEIMKNTNGDPEELAKQLAVLTGSTKLDS